MKNKIHRQILSRHRNFFCDPRGSKFKPNLQHWLVIWNMKSAKENPVHKEKNDKKEREFMASWG